MASSNSNPCAGGQPATSTGTVHGPLRRGIALSVLLALAPTASLVAASRKTPRLDDFGTRWSRSVAHLMTDAERTVYEALDDPELQERFAHRFWQARVGDDRGRVGDHTTPLLARWHHNQRAAIARDPRLHDARARALLVGGMPKETARYGCEGVIRRVEVWHWDTWQVAHQRGTASERGATLLFVRTAPDRDTYRIWSPDEGAGTLTLGGPGRTDTGFDDLVELLREDGCFRFSGPATFLRSAFDRAIDEAAFVDRLRPPAPDPGWLDAWKADAQRRTRMPAAPLEVEVVGRDHSKMVLRARVSVPVSHIARNAEGLLYDQLSIVGDIHRGSRLIDTFEVRHLVAGAEPVNGRVALDVHRRLRPGRYRLALRAADRFGRGLLRTSREVDVLAHDEPAVPPPGSRMGFAGLTREHVTVLTTLPAVEILSPGDDHLVGPIEIEAAVTGGPVAEVHFRLDGVEVHSDAEPPFSCIVDLGDVPERRRIEALARDDAGRVLAQDTRLLNAAPPRFAVRLVEPVTGGRAERAVIEVDVPAGETLDRVEIWLDRRRIAVLDQPPFAYDLPPIPGGGTRYVRAVAHLVSGAEREDLVFVRTAHPIDHLDVELVELYTTVTDTRGRPLTGLEESAFRVFEDGVVQPLKRFDTVADLAINVALLMDVSASMRRKVDVAAASARRFFDTVLTERDQASLLTINHDLDQRVPFTAEARQLGQASRGLRPSGTTRLHDGIVYSLYGFGGLAGKRALVVLSDGQDVDSDYALGHVADVASRTRVAIYPILLEAADDAVREGLEQLATATGGRLFVAERVGALDTVYRQIEEELRAQYLLVYEPAAGKARHTFRRIRVEVDGDGRRARTLTGYYP